MENENKQLPEEQEVAAETVTAEEETAPAVDETVPTEENVEATAEEIPEEPSVEVKKGILLTPGKLVGLIAGVVALVAVLVGAIVAGMGGFDKIEATAGEETAPATQPVLQETVPEETVPATIPADTGANDVTHKGTYTVSDEEIVKLADAVVVTAGDAVMTNRDLQVYYWMQVQNFLSNYYSYLSYFGLDYNKPLDTQTCAVLDNGYTWQQYFLEQAINNWHSYRSLTDMAAANGLELGAEEQAYLDGLADNITANAQSQGFANGDELVQFNVGAGGNLEAYVSYEELFLRGDVYYLQQEQAISITDAELEAYFDANADYYAESGITKDGIYVDVRHALVIPEGKNPGDEYTEEEWATIEAEAQALLDQWLAGDKTEESFAAMANEHSADSDGTDGGLYKDVYPGQMVTNFNDWCFDESRQPGDYGLVKTEYGYHIMYFVASRPMWISYAETGLMQEKTTAIVLHAREQYPMEVDYSAIALGNVDISKWFAQ